MEPTLRKRYDVAQHINDSRNYYRVWDNSLNKFVSDKLIERLAWIECNQMNDEEELYMKALTDYYNKTME